VRVVMGVSLVDGWVPPVLLGVGAAALFWLLVRWSRGALVTLVLALLLSALTFLGLNPLVLRVLDLVPDPLPERVLVWISVGVFGLVLAVGGLIHTRAWRKVLSVACGIVVLAAAGSQVNVYFQQYPTLGALLSADDPVDSGALAGGRGAASKPMPTPVVQRWKGKVTGTSSMATAPIPGTVSGLTARPAQIYLPAVYDSPNPPLLPVLVLVAGQPGGPDDWVTAGQLQPLMDGVAAAHGGLAPVTVVVDPNGADANDTMCMDSDIAKADTYLSKDVPAWIAANLGIDSNKAHWAFGGWSYGGTCALEMTTRHPDLYPSFIDMAGELEPAVSADRAQTVQAAFGGDTAAFDAQVPMTLLARHRYPQVWGYFSNGSEEPQVGQWMTTQAAAARQAGMTVQTQVVPGQGHSWGVPHASLPPALDFLGQRLGIRR